MKSDSRLKKDLISACRILSHEKLVQGFGHVSARIANSDLFLMTPADGPRPGHGERTSHREFQRRSGGRRPSGPFRNLAPYGHYES